MLIKTRTTIQDWEDVANENQILKAMKLCLDDGMDVMEGGTEIGYFAGPPGVGKTHTARACAKAGGKEAVVANPRTNDDFLNDCWECHKRKKALIIDDADFIFRSARCLEALNKAGDPDPRHREIQHYVHNPAFVKGCPKDTPRRIAVMIRFDYPMFICSNYVLARWKQIEPKLAERYESLESRIVPLLIPTPSPEEMWEYTAYLALCQNLTRNNMAVPSVLVPLRVQQYALRWFTRHMWFQIGSDRSPRRLRVLVKRLMRNPHPTDYPADDSDPNFRVQSWELALARYLDADLMRKFEGAPTPAEPTWIKNQDRPGYTPPEKPRIPLAKRKAMAAEAARNAEDVKVEDAAPEPSPLPSPEPEQPVAKLKVVSDNPEPKKRVRPKKVAD